MSRKQKAPPSEASKAYLVSFGDTMTALLAFFIVLNSLAEEQSGADLYSGTGSFVAATNSVGLPGKFSDNKSANVAQFQGAGTIYIEPSEEKDGRGSGASDEANSIEVLDTDEEQFIRFLNDMDRVTTVERLDDAHGDVVFDFFEAFNVDGPLLKKKTLRAILKRLLLRLLRLRMSAASAFR